MMNSGVPRAVLQGMLDQCPQAFICIDDKQRIRVFSKSAERLFDYRQEDILGQDLDVLLPADVSDRHPDLAEAFGPSANDSRQMGEGFGHDWTGTSSITCVRRDGTEFGAVATIASFADKEKTYYTVQLRGTSREDGGTDVVFLTTWLQRFIGTVTEEADFEPILRLILADFRREDIPVDNLAIQFLQDDRGTIGFRSFSLRDADPEFQVLGYSGSTEHGGFTAYRERLEAHVLTYRNAEDMTQCERDAIDNVYGMKGSIQAVVDVPFAHMSGSFAVNSRKHRAFTSEAIGRIKEFAVAVEVGLQRFRDHEELRLSEERYRVLLAKYRNLFDNAPAMYVVTELSEGSTEPVIKDCSLEFSRRTGIRQSRTHQ